MAGLTIRGAPYQYKSGAHHPIVWHIGSVPHDGRLPPFFYICMEELNNIPGSRFCRRDNEPIAIMQPGTVLKKNIWGECPSPTKYQGIEWRTPKAGESSAEWGEVWCGMSLSQPTMGLGSVAFRHSLKATERFFLHIYADDLSSSNSVSYHISGSLAKV